MASAPTELQRITHAIVGVAQPVRVVLFGSHARGEARAESDYDVMVEIDEAGRRDELFLAIADAMRVNGWSVDASIRGPGEFDRGRDHPFYVDYDIARDGRVLYDRAGVPTDWPGPARVSESNDPASRAAPWLEHLWEDFEIVDLVASGIRAPSPICLHAHAAAEKLLKAAVYVSGRYPPHIHDLSALLRLCPTELRDRDDLQQACALLYAKWPASRHPLRGVPPLTLDDARRAAAAATLIRAAIIPLLK